MAFNKARSCTVPGSASKAQGLCASAAPSPACPDPQQQSYPQTISIAQRWSAG